LHSISFHGTEARFLVLQGLNNETDSAAFALFELALLLCTLPYQKTSVISAWASFLIATFVLLAFAFLGLEGTTTTSGFLCIYAISETLHMHSYDIDTPLPARTQITPAYLLLPELIVSSVDGGIRHYLSH